MQGSTWFDMSVYGTYALTLEAGSAPRRQSRRCSFKARAKLRVFAAVPPAWPEVVFENLRAEGAFRVSALRRKGKTQWVRVASEVGGPCRVKTDFGTSDLKAHSSSEAKSFIREGDAVVFDTARGEEFWMAPAGFEKQPVLAPVKGRPEQYHFFGVKKDSRMVSPRTTKR